MARTKGAKDKRKRKRRDSPQILKANQTTRNLRNLELATRSVGNLSRGLNAIGNSI